jgi:RND superfamily putative drug exporter
MSGTERGRHFITGRIGGWCARRRWLVAPLGLLALLLAIASLTVVGADTDPGQGGTGESVRAAELLEERFGDLAASDPPSEFVVFSHPTLTVEDPAYRRTVTDLVEELRALRFEAARSTPVAGLVSTRIVGNTLTHYDIGLPRDRSPFVATREGAGDVTYAVVELEGESDASVASSVPFVFDEIAQVTDAVAAASERAQGFEIVIGGDASASKQSEDNIAEDFSRASSINLPLTFVILIVALGTLLAALLPIGLAFGGVVTAIGVLALLSQLYPLEPVFIQVVLLIGLAAGIDYALFMIARYRRERAAGQDRVDAVSETWATTGRNVLIAATTTVLSIAGMYLVGDPVFTALGMAAMVAVIVAAIIAMAVLPALTGDWLNRLRVPGLQRPRRLRPSLVTRIASPVVDASLRRPGVAGALAVVVLLGLASPVIGLSTGFNGARGLNDDVAAKAAFLALEENFTLGLASPAQVVVDAGANQNVFDPDIQAAVARLGDAVVAENAAAEAEGRHVPFGPGIETGINNAGDTEVVSIPINADTGEQRAFDAVALLRNDLIPEAFADAPAEVLVTGQSAGQSDFTDNINSRTPLVYAFVLITAFLLLLVMYRSLAIAAITVVLNLLAVAAAYGVLVLVFQEGYAFEGLFGFEATGIIESWLPLFVFTIMFGISMDYLTFAIGRVKELHDEGRDTESAIREAVEDGYGVIFSAAAVMVAVAIVFAFTRDIGLQQFGFTLAVAVILDATVILAVLLPAVLRLAGDRLWYVPSWLQWLPGARPTVASPSTADTPEAARP